MNTTETETAAPRRKSVRLTKDEYKAFKDFRKTFHTGVECAEAIGVSRLAMLRVLQVGSGSPETIEKIKTAITNENNLQ
jgi:hypothetical protein